MIYLDSSALLKLLFEESESAALALWISEQTGTPMVTSELAKVEVVRAARRLDADVVPAARVLMSQLDLIPLSSGLLNEAADVGEPLVQARRRSGRGSSTAGRSSIPKRRSDQDQPELKDLGQHRPVGGPLAECRMGFARGWPITA